MALTTKLTQALTTSLTQPLTGFAGAFSPSDIAGLSLWLDASDADTITESGGAVSQWDDKSDEGNNAAQSTSSLQPTTGTETINGLNALDFAGNDALDYTPFLFDLGSCSVFAVVSCGSQNDTRFIGESESGDQGFFGVYGIDSTEQKSFYRDDGNVTRINSVGSIEVADGLPHVLSYTDSETQFISYVDGQEDINTSYVRGSGMQPAFANIGSMTSNSGGRISHYDGLFAELIVYDGVLSDTDRERVENYLTDKWVYSIAGVANPVLHLDASDTDTITESGGSVSQWDDKSGLGNNATQSTGSIQPTTGTRTINGLNVLDFSTDALNISNSSSISLDGSYTVFAILEADTLPASDGVNYLSKGGAIAANDAYRFRIQDSGEAWALINDGSVSTFSSTTQISTGQSALVTTIFDAGTDVSFKINGGAEESTSTSANSINTINDPLNVGSATSNASTEVFDGKIAELIMYPRALTTDEITAIENYLTNKWGIS